MKRKNQVQADDGGVELPALIVYRSGTGFEDVGMNGGQREACRQLDQVVPEMFALERCDAEQPGREKGALAKIKAKSKRMYMDAVMAGFLFGHCRRRCRLNYIAERHILTKTAASDTAAVAAAYSVFSNALAHQSITVCGIMPHSSSSRR